MRTIILAVVANLGVAAAASDYLIQSWEINQGLPQVSVLAIAQTRDRYLWVGTFGGLARFDGLTFTNFDSGTTPGLPSNRIVGLCEDSRGSLWVGTAEAGVAEYRDGVFRTYSEKDGLPSNRVRALVADSAGDVWIATWKGLVRRRGGRFELFPSEAGEGCRGWRVDTLPPTRRVTACRMTSCGPSTLTMREPCGSGPTVEGSRGCGTGGLLTSIRRTGWRRT
jgi:ligand-binding sensor domain-containing protein